MVTKDLEPLNLQFDQVRFNSLVLTWERNFEVTFGIFSVNSYRPDFEKFDPYGKRNPIQDTGCPAGILAYTISRENTTNEVETMLFLEGTVHYRLHAYVSKPTVLRYNEDKEV